MKSIRDQSNDLHNNFFNITVLISGLGYLIDTFDFFLYNSMRVVSLTDLGLSGDSLTQAGILILNCQIFGALIGSFFWGILGDRIGRKKALIGSIFIYSVFMIANGFVTSSNAYALVRFIIGFGVAGEVGLGATLVAETIESSKRTYALMIFTILGVLGVAAAGISIELVSWRTCCFIGGGAGILLLGLRSALFESQIFISSTLSNIRRGSLKDLFGQIQMLKKYILLIPILGSNFFVTGIILTLSPEIAKSTGVTGTVKANLALALYFTIAACGDYLSGWLSEKMRRRKPVVMLYLAANFLLTLWILNINSISSEIFYILCGAFGLFNLWAIVGTMLVELFPTSLRATASTSNINFSRATVIIMNFSFLALKPAGVTYSLLTIGSFVFLTAFACLLFLPESYGKSLEE